MKLQNGSMKKDQTTGDSTIKLTPQTYIDMNEEFEENGDRVRINVPTQEAIDKWQEWSRNQPYIEMPPSRDLVQEMWDAIGGRPND